MAYVKREIADDFPYEQLVGETALQRCMRTRCFPHDKDEAGEVNET